MDDFSVTIRRVSDVIDQAMGRVDSIFESFFDGSAVTVGHQYHRVRKETKDGVQTVVVELEVPGCKKEDLDLSVSPRSMQVEWVRKLDGQKNAVKIAISEKADLDAITAKVEDGYMTIVIPAAKPQASKKVRID
jgi:HSP20 family molecular chaperone IbpA